jgi:cytochrome c551/c552
VVVAGLVLVAALAGCSPMQASTAPGTHAAAARTTASGGTWGTAKEVPGIAALATDVNSYPLSVSCGAAGNCSAGGYYTTYVKKPNPQEAFVVSEKGGAWGTAKEVPGTAALNQGRDAQLASVSCAAAGNCSAGGFYTDGSGHQQAFVVGEANGSWGTAKEVPGFAALNKGVFTALAAVSCASAGNCSAGGSYTDGSGHHQAFVVSEKGGTWGTAKEVPGTAALNQGGNAQLASVSCPSAGNCSADGSYYTDSSGHHQAFVVSQTNGTWGTAKAVPGTAALNQGGYAAVVQVSCASAGNCGAGGSYVDSSGHDQAFVVGEKGGAWGTAKQVPGTSALNHGGSAHLASVSCASAGNCSATGGYFNFNDSSSEVFVVSQTNGTWGTAKEVPGFAALNQGGNAQPASVSCASAGHCSAVGFYTTRPRNGFNEAFVVNET